MIFNEQLEKRETYDLQALEASRAALDEMVNQHQDTDEKMKRLLLHNNFHRLDRTFPARPLHAKDLLRFGMESVNRVDVFYVLLLGLVVTLIGMLTPYLAKQVYDEIIPSGTLEDLPPVLGILIGASIGAVMFSLTRDLVLMRIQQKVETSLQAAMMERTYAMPPTFFRRYPSGDMSNRVMSMTYLSQTFTQGIVSNLFTLLFSFIYFYQVIYYAKALLPYCLLVMLANILFMVWEYWMQRREDSMYLPRQSTLQGLLFSIFSGIKKIKTSGSEVRAFSKWAKAYRDSRPSAYTDFLGRFSQPVSGFISVAGMALIYYQTVEKQVPLSDFMAFTVAFGLVSAGFMSMTSIVPSIATAQSLYALVKPVLEEVPETYEESHPVTSLSGSIEVHNLSFRYAKDTPFVLKNFNLKIRPGEYVGIVGKSGCGKSTLIRLLLGFDKAESGSIFYDSYNMEKVNKRALRQRVGTCVQDGELFSGSILSNITITAPWATEEDAWEAVRLAALDKDIEKMPMKMQTVLSEGGSNISGGQRQRLLIARALVNKPSILFFDEATSALDNINQKIVSDNLSTLKCTRICVAHRLSTIMHCDRIVVIDGGKVAEEGTYQELIEKKALFYQLVKQQQL